MDDYDARDQSDMDWEYGYDVGYAAGVEEGMEYEDELRAELTEMYEELLRSYADWEDVAELRYSEGL